MDPTARVSTTGTIDRPGPGHTYIARLPNTKEVICYPADASLEPHLPLEPGTRVTLELSTYDFSRARITALAEI